MDAVAPLLLAILSVIVLVVLVRLLTPTQSPQLSSPVEAAALADSLPGGFAVAACALDRAGCGAVLRDSAGRIAVVVPLGAHFVVRLLDHGCSAGYAGDGLLDVHSGDVSCRLDLGRETGTWVQAIARLGT